MKKIILLLLLPIFTSHNLYSINTNNSKDSLYFFTSNLLFIPTESSIIESKIGVIKFTDKKNLKLDIGVSFDMIGYRSFNYDYSLGVDFFTTSNLRSESNFKFPVDAIDYLFGVNFNMKKRISGRSVLFNRLRISHISSHFEDGHIYERSDTIFKPFVFSKEFIDFATVLEVDLSKKLFLKNLVAVNFIIHSIPKELSVVSGRFGIELNYFLSGIMSLYISNDLNFASVNSRSNLNENFEGGISIGRKNSRRVNIFFTYYDGQDYRGQYYGKYLNNKGIGLKFKF
ncbi:MAG: DUF1207 domain-containing protein [Ignavibacteria bacterium]